MPDQLQIPLLFVAAVIVIAVYGLYEVTVKRIRSVGTLTFIGRWLTGKPWHGKDVTDAGWFRPGSKALTRTGHAPRRLYAPRWRRAAWRSGSLAVLLTGAYGYLVAPSTTMLAALVAGGLGLAAAVWRTVRKVRERQHRRTWTYPLHAAVAQLVNIPPGARPTDWIQLERDRSRAVLALPPGFIPDPRVQTQVAAAAATKLGLEAPEVRWQLAGPRPRLTLAASKPPPDAVNLDRIRDAITGSRPDDLVLGVGKKDQLVKISLAGDSPHLGLSMASGSGKSIAARLLATQILHRGGVVFVLDIKRVSHSWVAGLPNVAVAKTPAQIHAALLWLEGELDRRHEVADLAADLEGRVMANVGPTCLVVIEEINLLSARLKAYWRQARDPSDPTRSPAVEALDALLFAGRSARIHALEIGQRLSAAATGGDARENLAVRILGRYSKSTWTMLAGDHPMPPPSRAPGRVQVVDHRVRECQVGFLTAVQARELALSGTVAPLPYGIPGAPQLAGRETETALPNRGDDLRILPVSPVPVSPDRDLVSLRDAQATGILSGSLAGVRTARHRNRGDFPTPVSRHGLTELYDVDDLRLWEARRGDRQ